MTEPGLPRVPQFERRRTTSDDVADALREAILRGYFEDGEELNQVAIARHYGVSRAPLREALRVLQAEGLVAARAHQRTIVVGLTLDRVLEVIDIRIMLERYLVRHAVPRLTPERIDELTALCDAMDGAAGNVDWLRWNREFHDRLYEPSGLALTLEISAQLSGRIERYLHMWGSGDLRREESGAEHRRILAAAVARDAQRAGREMEVHLMHARESIIKLFTAERGGADRERTGAGA